MGSIDISLIPQIKIAPDYFRDTVRKESSYPLLWRVAKETLQNSIDAGATKYEVRLYPDTGVIEIEDNGCGMTEDILLNEFLALGGSEKPEGAIGGFGDAKKVICFCWDKWEIHTQDNFLSSSMLGREPIKKTAHRKGTLIRIWVGDDCDCYGRDIIDYLSLCQVDARIRVKIIRPGDVPEEITIQRLYRRKACRSLDFGSLYVNRSGPENFLSTLVVRYNGLALFTESLWDTNAICIFELNNMVHPKDKDYMLNVTRERLNYRYQSRLHRLIQEIVSNPSSLKEKKPDPIVSIRKSTAVLSTYRRRFKGFKGLSNALFQMGTHYPMSRPCSVLRDQRDDFIYPYDYCVKGNTNLRLSSLKYQKLLFAWHKLIDNAIFWNEFHGLSIDPGEYRIGFIFDEDILASYTVLDGEIHFLLNPTGISFKDYSTQGLVCELLKRACHELAHVSYGFHDGNFAAHEGEILRNCFKHIGKITSSVGRTLNSSKRELVKDPGFDDLMGEPFPGQNGDLCLCSAF